MTNNYMLRRQQLSDAAIEYAKSLFEVNLTQKENKVFLEIKIDDDVLFSIDLNSISSFNNINLTDGIVNIDAQERKPE
jgi:hypothetical protein